jgi:putative sporulation protein YtaF
VLQFLSLLALALAVSLDGFGVGVSYGLRKIRIPIASIIMITSCSAIVILLAMFLGQWISHFIGIRVEKLIGAWILIGVGSWAIFNLSRNKETNVTPHPHMDQGVKKVLKIEIKMLGLVIQILKTPTAADVDRSGSISIGEAALLGFALSLDAFGAGIGAALMGYPPLTTALLVSVFSTVLILVGLRLGFYYSGVAWIKRLSFLPGVILILIGISRIW